MRKCEKSIETSVLFQYIIEKIIHRCSPFVMPVIVNGGTMKCVIPSYTVKLHTCNRCVHT